MDTKNQPVCTHPGLCLEMEHITTQKQLTAFLDMYNLTAKVTETFATGALKAGQQRINLYPRKTLHITGGEIDITVTVDAKLFDEKVS